MQAARRAAARISISAAPAAWLLNAVSAARAVVLTDNGVAYREGGPPIEQYADDLRRRIPALGLVDLLDVALAAYCQRLWSAGRVSGYTCSTARGRVTLAVARGPGVAVVIRLPELEAPAYQIAASAFEEWLRQWEERLGLAGRAQQAAARAPRPAGAPAAGQPAGQGARGVTLD